MTYIEDLAERIKARVPSEALPSGDTELLFQLYALLATAKGGDTEASDVHDAWVVWMLGRNPKHPSIMPFSQLDSKTKQADEPFVRAIRDAARQQG